jgi:hypothetical protein
VSSLRRGHANLLCIAPILVYVLPKQARLKRKTVKFEQRRRREPKCVLLKSGTLLKPQGYSRKTAQCSYKNVESFTILHVILAQGPCKSLKSSNFSICTAKASTLEKENIEI